MQKALWLIIFVSSYVTGQGISQTIVIGNTNNICFSDSSLTLVDSLPGNLEDCEAIFMFSNATSNLSETDVSRIESFLLNGGGVYMGSDNWPLQAEANQITKEFYQKESFGLYDVDVAQVNQVGNLKLSEKDTVPAGKTTSAFPLDYRLTVEAWVDDQPLILTGNYGKGKIVIDTGYSRFYCDQRNEHTDLLFKKIYGFLREEEEVKLR